MRIRHVVTECPYMYRSFLPCLNFCQPVNTELFLLLTLAHFHTCFALITLYFIAFKQTNTIYHKRKWDPRTKQPNDSLSAVMERGNLQILDRRKILQTSQTYVELSHTHLLRER